MTRLDKSRTRIVRIGNSLGVRLPKTMLELIGVSTKVLQAGDIGPEVELKVSDGAITITPIRDDSPSFSDRVAPLIETASARTMLGQELVLQALAGTVDWVTRADKARARLASAVDKVYFQHRRSIQDIRSRGQLLWNEKELLWMLFVSRVVMSDYATSHRPPLTYDELHQLVQDSERPDEPAIKQIVKILESAGLLARAEGLARDMVRYYELIKSKGGLDKVTEEFRSLDNRRAMRHFLKQLETDSTVLASKGSRSYGMFDELFDERFNEQLLINNEMWTLLSELELVTGPYAHLSDNRTDDERWPVLSSSRKSNEQTPFERFFMQVAEQARVEPWELEQLIMRHHPELSKELKKSEDQPADQSYQTAVSGAK